MQTRREYTALDRIIIGFDGFLHQLTAENKSVSRSSPADNVVDGTLTPTMQSVSAGLMRVNHAGEVAAQALYQGQTMTARDRDIQQIMKTSADEEVDHLVWCQKRLDELGSHTSFLGPVWYSGSLALGILTGLIGDRWSLGFLAETENQVVRHLDSHLDKLPGPDNKSRAILEQMRKDESHHVTVAIESGAVELPVAVRRLMQLCSKVMTTTAYRI